MGSTGADYGDLLYAMKNRSKTLSTGHLCGGGGVSMATVPNARRIVEKRLRCHCSVKNSSQHSRCKCIQKPYLAQSTAKTNSLGKGMSRRDKAHRAGRSVLQKRREWRQ
ncbi:MAG: hypothetical protein R2861_14010 [Desulfobacterales bacterium]